jgi:hypothetical protein
MTTELATTDTRDITSADRDQAAGAVQHILATGDLSKLSNEQRVAYYLELCRVTGLNSLSRPFDWLQLDGKLVLYPNKSCTEQLRRQHQISVKITRREMAGELYVVEVEGRTPSGRTDVASKYVPVTYWDRQTGRQQRLAGDKLANAYAKAETGAKRRLVLSMVGLAAIPDADETTGGRAVIVDGTGAVLDHPTEEQRYLAETPAAARAIGAPTFESTASASGSAPPIEATASQAVTPEELERPKSPGGPRPTFKPSEADIKRWRGRFHALAEGTSFADDDYRHRFMQQYTDGRVDSTEAFWASATERQAADLLAYVEALAADEKRARREAADDDLTEEERPF